MRTVQTLTWQPCLLAAVFTLGSFFVSVNAARGQCPLYDFCSKTSPNKLLLIKDKAPAGPSAKDKLIWKFSGSSASQANFGDPITGGTDYTVCLYLNPHEASAGTAVATIPGGGTCSGKPCWKAIGTKGWKYKNKNLDADGVKTVLLKGGDPIGSGKIIVKAKDGNIPLPTLPLDPGTTGVEIQLHRSDSSPGECFATRFDLGAVVKNDATQFKAK